MAVRAIIKRSRVMPEILRRPRLAWLSALAMLALLVLPSARALAQDPVEGEVSVAVAEEGYARLIFHLAQEVESEVRVAGGIVIIAFKRPVNVAVDRVAASATGYIGAARRDPDGMGVRIALARKVRVNSMAAGERLFVDLLPEPWAGVVPGLPQEVIDDLTRRAREAEKLARQQIALTPPKQALIRVRVGKQPTFTRYSFDLPRNVAVSNDRVDKQIKLVFDAPLKFDLADAQAEQPAGVESIEAESNGTSISVRFTLAAKVDVRTFREEGSYIIDIGNPNPQKQAEEPGEERSEAGPETDAPKDALGQFAAPKEVSKPSETRQAARAAAPSAPAAAAKPAASSAKGASSIAPAKPAVVAAKPPPAVAPGPAPEAEQAAMPSPAPSPPEKSAPAPAVAPPPIAAAKQVAAKAGAPAGPGAVVAEMRQGDDLHIKFPFGAPTPAAVFRRADTLWVVFDSKRELDVQALSTDTSQTIRGIALTRAGETHVLRIKLQRPRLASLSTRHPSRAR